MSGLRATLIGTPVVAAPGKIFLVGGYAVLEGGAGYGAAVLEQVQAAKVVPPAE